MSMNPQEFGRLLKEARDQAQREKHLTMGAIDRRLSEQVTNRTKAKCSEYTIRRWCKGKLPDNRRGQRSETVNIIVEYFIALMDQRWERDLREAAGCRHKGNNGDHHHHSLASRLKALRLIHASSNSGLPFAMLGSVYLDQLVDPVSITTLKKREITGVNSISFHLGGSSILCGRFLYLISGGKVKSHVYSARGRGDNHLNKIFLELLGVERVSSDEGAGDDRWLHDHILPTGDALSSTAVTIHLVQDDDAFRTMLTSPSVLDGFTWQHAIDELQTILGNAGILYISGYFKTRLWVGFTKNLKALPRGALRCLDHGSLDPSLVRPSAVAGIRRAFDERLIDVYFCTLSELLAICGLPEETIEPHRRLSDTEVLRLLDSLPMGLSLPPITVIRDEDFEQTKVYLILDRKVVPLEGAAVHHIANQCVGPSNAFNASFMWNLVSRKSHLLDEGNSFEELKEVGRLALNDWANASKLLAP